MVRKFGSTGFLDKADSNYTEMSCRTESGAVSEVCEKRWVKVLVCVGAQ